MLVATRLHMTQHRGTLGSRVIEHRRIAEHQRLSHVPQANAALLVDQTQNGIQFDDLACILGKAAQRQQGFTPE